METCSKWMSWQELLLAGSYHGPRNRLGCSEVFLNHVPWFSYKDVKLVSLKFSYDTSHLFSACQTSSLSAG